MGVQFTGSLDVLGSVNTSGTAISSLGSSNITGSLGLTGSMELAYTTDGTTITKTVTYDSGSGALVMDQIFLISYVDDAGAAAGGVPVGGLYRTNGSIKMRLS